MTDETNSQEATGPETITRNFKGHGKFTVRGILAGEKMDIQGRSMTVNERKRDMDVDAKAILLQEVREVLEESPEGPHPSTLWLASLPSGLVEKLHTDMKNLSMPEEIVEEN